MHDISSNKYGTNQKKKQKNQNHEATGRNNGCLD